jgi:hypothetical protein
VSGVLLLCILPAPAVPGTQLAHVTGQPVEGLTVPPLSLWIRSAEQPRAPDLEEVRAHHRIVEAAWKAHPAVLPVRFGQWFATAAELEAAVRDRVETYAAALERVRGRGEFSIRVLDPAVREPASAGSAASGTEYLRGAAGRARHRAALDARGREVAGELSTALGALVKDGRVAPLPSPHGLAEIAHLVERADEIEYQRALEAFTAARPELLFTRTGPWPAWTFAG